MQSLEVIQGAFGGAHWPVNLLKLYLWSCVAAKLLRDCDVSKLWNSTKHQGKELPTNGIPQYVQTLISGLSVLMKILG
jgi:hypothetical protein